MTDKVLTFAWMYPITDIKVNECAPLGTSYIAIGNHIGINDHTLAVSEHGTGAGRLYCSKHQAIFNHAKRCPVCAGTQVQE